MEAKGPHISIKGETLVNFFGFNVTNSLFTSLIVTIIFLLIALYYSSEVKKKKKGMFFYILHGAIESLYTLFSSVLGKHVNTFFALLVSFFFFILLNNWFGLLPFVGSLLVKPISIPAVESVHAEAAHTPLLRAATADLNTTIALALITVLFTQYMGFKYLGAGKHLKKYASVVGGLEAFSEISRVLSFSFRLFGNIFAGEVMIGIISFLIPFLTPPFFLFEVFVGFMQAFVFSMLSAVFINLAVSEGH
jgi:F-type H+-transporting ATPase subunit a